MAFYSWRGGRWILRTLSTRVDQAGPTDVGSAEDKRQEAGMKELWNCGLKQAFFTFLAAILFSIAAVYFPGAAIYRRAWKLRVPTTASEKEALEFPVQVFGQNHWGEERRNETCKVMHPLSLSTASTIILPFIGPKLGDFLCPSEIVASV